jgi:membrane protease YdiL (CAAX protease family)
MTNSDQLLSEATPRPPNLLPFGAGAIIFVLLFVGGSLVGGELGSFMTASGNAIPFAILALLAYMGGSRLNWAWFATALWLLLMIAVTGLVTLGLSIAALSGGLPDATAGALPLTDADWLRIAVIAFSSMAAVGVSVILLVTPVRRFLARWLPLEPTSFVHTIALVTVVVMSLLTTIPLLVLGSPPLLALVDLLSGSAADENSQLRVTIYGLIWTVPATLLAVGFGLTRDLRAALVRLGLVRPTIRQVAAAVVIALLLVAAVQLLSGGIEQLWGWMGWPTTDEEAFGELLAFAINPVGALVIGITAGLGEELAVRGVLQPRLGILLSNLFFVSLHALQYNWDALLIVFIVGLACGFVRRATNTTTAAVVHGVYNFTLVMLAINW